MTKFRVIYQAFSGSDLTSSDIIVHGEDEADARRVFERIYPQFIFVKAEAHA